MEFASRKSWSELFLLLRDWHVWCELFWETNPEA
jgi:hypothetical protein